MQIYSAIIFIYLHLLFYTKKDLHSKKRGIQETALTLQQRSLSENFRFFLYSYMWVTSRQTSVRLTRW